MIKTYLKTNPKICKVTFDLPGDTNAQTASVVGEFNNWSAAATPLKRKRDGRFALTLHLETERAYRFRYLLDGERWLNDPRADAYMPNAFGTEDSVVVI